MKVSEEFRDAEVLADFANLDRDDIAKVEYFRNNYPDFAPAEWWDYKFEENELVSFVCPYGDNPVNPAEFGAVMDKSRASIWHDTQSQVWGAWDNEFKFPNVFVLTSLLRSVFVAPAEMVLASLNLYLPDGELCELNGAKLYQFQKAVLYFYHQPWRAKICKGCGKYFVVNHPKRDFCTYPDELGVTCRQKSDNDRHLIYYHETGKRHRQVKTRKNGSRHATRKNLRQR